MHRNKTKTPPPTPPETRPASEAIVALTAQVAQQVALIHQNLGAIALRDAKLDPADGWRYNVESGQYVKVG